MATVHKYILKQYQELRFEIESTNADVHLTLIRGTAEIFGAELVRGKIYEFKRRASIAVFTWHGCLVDVKGDPDLINTVYTASETPMGTYMNCHGALEIMRFEAEKQNTRGPIAMVVGPKNVGKSTVCRILLNYAVRVGRKPVFVDLDVDQGQITIPGTIGALPVVRPSVYGCFADKTSLIYNFGHIEPTTNGTLYNLQVRDLATTVKRRLDATKRIRASGAVINTFGWRSGERYKLLLSSAKAFEVDVLLVLHQERLYNELLRDMPTSTEVVLIPKSGGAVDVPEEIRSETWMRLIREYFYGTPSKSIEPHLLYVKYSQVRIFKIGAPAIPESCLPFGMQVEDSTTKLVLLQPSVSLVNHILAISFADKEGDEVVFSHVAGFVCVADVFPEWGVLKLLSPLPAPLPGHILVLSDLLFANNY